MSIKGGQDVRTMMSIDGIITIYGACILKTPEGVPVQNEDGAWEVMFESVRHLEKVKKIIVKDYNFEIVREVIGPC